VAESFARIFRRNMYNCGMVAVEVPRESLDLLFSRFSGSDTRLSLDLEAGSMTFSSDLAGTLQLPLSLGEFELAMVRSGGWVEFAADRY